MSVSQKDGFPKPKVDTCRGKVGVKTRVSGSKSFDHSDERRYLGARSHCGLDGDAVPIIQVDIPLLY